MDLLTALFQPVVPQSVIDEWKAGETSSGPRSLPPGCTVAPFVTLDPFLCLKLDTGEAAVIQTAREGGIALILMDERRGRKIARRVYGLQTIGTARLLVEAHRAGLIQDLATAFETLKSESYWIADDIVQWALSESLTQRSEEGR